MPSRTPLWAARFQPAPIPPAAVVLLSIISAGGAGWRGLDWLTADAHALSPVLTMAYVPISWTGAGLLSGSIFLLLTLALRRHFFIWLAYLHLAFVYACVVLAGYPIAEQLGSGHSVLAGPALSVVWFTMLARVAGPRPATRGD